MPRTQRLAHFAAAYILAVAGALTAASIALRAGARAVERSISETAA